jgi:heme A synthase
VAPISPRFARFAWGVLAYNLAVILWGAYVRASGSGAGCGRHWPLCNGEVVPRAESVKTIIEFSHRASSGVVLVLVVAMTAWAFRAAPKGHPVRRGAVLSLVFTLTEALVGAGLVLFELVAHDASMKRALSMALHLTNTFVLLACLSLTAYWASGGPRLRVRGQGALPWLVGPTLAGVVLLGTSGAIAALGDTLFPARSLAEGLAQDLSVTAHVFLKLRVLHPLIATFVGAACVGLGLLLPSMRPTPRVRFWARAAVTTFAVQYVAGLVNVALLAPVWMQLVHLLLADGAWISLILACGSALSEEGTASRAASDAAAPGATLGA